MSTRHVSLIYPTQYNDVCYSLTFMIIYEVLYTVIYRLIAAATITFSQLKGAATKQGWLLYEGGH